MKQLEISIKILNGDAVSWIERLRQVLLIQDNGKGTVKNYTAENSVRRNQSLDMYC